MRRLIWNLRSYVGAIVVGIGHSIMPRDMRKIMTGATDIGLKQLHEAVDNLPRRRPYPFGNEPFI